MTEGLPPHHDGRRFFNPGQPGTDRTPGELLRWRLSGGRAPWVRAAPVVPARPAAREAGLAVTLVGHASVLIQVAGCNILVDPVWSRRAGPMPFVGPARWDAPGIRFRDLPPMDAVLVTHSHYDHLDTSTLRRLAREHRPLVLAPLGNERVLRGAMRSCRVETRDWGGGVNLSATVRATVHPAWHWSARTPFDRRRALWGGFVIEAPGRVVYVAGDTAYGDGWPFRLVRERFGPPDLALLPIGAYEPRWFMRAQHANPAEAVRMMHDCGARQALGVHWGTFQLTDEPRFAPAEALAAACRADGVEPGRFLPLRPGQVWRAADQTPGRPE